MSRSHPFVTTSFTLALALAAALAIPACSSTEIAADPEDGTTRTRTPDDADAAAKDLQALYDLLKEQPQTGAASTRTTPAKLTRVATPAPTKPEPTEPEGPPSELAAPPALAAKPPQPAPPTTDERQAGLVAELLELLQQRSAASHDPSADAMIISLLASLDPEAAGPKLKALAADLSPAQREMLEAVRELAAQLPTAASKDPRELSALLDRVSAKLSAQQGGALTLPTVALCSRVESFGRYTPLTSTAFLAGRAQPAIVYTEVAGFTHQPRSSVTTDAPDTPQPDGEWTVNLGQTLSLFHSDGTLAWKRAEQTIRDVSRNQRRDYYLVQRIDLPPTLSIGSYNLKVAVRDLNSSASIEQIVPLTVVADAGLIEK